MNQYRYYIYSNTGLLFSDTTKMSIGDYTGLLRIELDESVGPFDEMIRIRVRVYDAYTNSYNYEYSGYFDVKVKMDCEPTLATYQASQYYYVGYSGMACVFPVMSMVGRSWRSPQESCGNQSCPSCNPPPRAGITRTAMAARAIRPIMGWRA